MVREKKAFDPRAVAILGAFLAFSVVVGFWGLREVDLWTTVFLQAVIPRLFDVPLSLLSLLGALEITGLILVVIVWQVGELRRYWLFLFFGFGLLVGVETFSKHFLGQPRPPSIYYRYSLPIFFPTSKVETKYAYPSGHMSRTAFLITILWFLVGRKVPASKKRRCFWGLGVAGILMAISRVYLGEHWLTDVVGGAMLGTGMGLGVFQALYYFGDRLKFDKVPLDS